MTIGEGLKRCRKERGLSQRKFADSLGISCSLYQSYEYDKIVPSAKVAMKMADAYGVTMDYLLGRSDSPVPLNVDARVLKEALAAREELRQLRSLLVPAMANQSGAIAK